MELLHETEHFVEELEQAANDTDLINEFNRDEHKTECNENPDFLVVLGEPSNPILSFHGPLHQQNRSKRTLINPKIDPIRTRSHCCTDGQEYLMITT